MNEGIAIRGLRVFGRHGANHGERDVPQPFDVDVELELDLGPARASDALTDTVDYGQVARCIRAIVAQTSYALLERLGDEIARAVMEDGRIRHVRVTVAKPRLLEGATPAVTVSARR